MGMVIFILKWLGKSIFPSHNEIKIIFIQKVNKQFLLFILTSIIVFWLLFIATIFGPLVHS